MADSILRDVDEFIEEMNFSANEGDLRRAVEAALRTATQKTASAVRTDFTRATVVDDFFVRRSLDFGVVGRSRVGDVRYGDGRILRGFGAAQTTFVLTRGMVDTAASITVVAAQRHQGLALSEEQVDLKNSPEGDFTLFQSDVGFMRVLDYGLQNSYVRVGYTAGFTTDTGCPAVYQNTPLWLREVCTLKATLALNNNPVIREQAALTPEQLREIKQQVDEIVQDHARYMPQAERPIGGTVTAV